MAKLTKKQKLAWIAAVKVSDAAGLGCLDPRFFFPSIGCSRVAHRVIFLTGISALVAELSRCSSRSSFSGFSGRGVIRQSIF